MKKNAFVPWVWGSILFLCSISLSFSQTVYTGLIFDAGNSSFTPSASPKILDEDGREVYGSAYVDKGWVEKQGIVGYAKSLEEARKQLLKASVTKGCILKILIRTKPDQHTTMFDLENLDDNLLILESDELAIDQWLASKIESTKREEIRLSLDERTYTP